MLPLAHEAVPHAIELHVVPRISHWEVCAGHGNGPPLENAKTKELALAWSIRRGAKLGDRTVVVVEAMDGSIESVYLVSNDPASHAPRVTRVHRSYAKRSATHRVAPPTGQPH
jgi:hypothetical protein